MTASTPYDYTGEPTLREPIEAALREVVDPEMALNIVDIGLVYRVDVDDSCARVTMTMTSAACPVTDVIIDEVYEALERAVPEPRQVAVELCWEPPWTPARLSAQARAFMGW